MTGLGRLSPAKMTAAEIAEYLHSEESLTVEFLLDCPGLGFLVSPEQDEATIPQGYHAMIPFWLAVILGMPQGGGRRIVQVAEPPWLRSLGAGTRIDTERSYFFAANVGRACGDESASKRLIELAKERVRPVLDTALQPRRRQFDPTGELVLLTEEKELIAESHRAVESFARWKAGDVATPRRFS
jgi:hypothetical protein